MAPEPFVSAQEAAKFIGISRRFFMELARRGIIGGAYPIGTGELRKHGSSAFRNSPQPSVGKATEFSVDRRNASERIIQSLGVPY